MNKLRVGNYRRTDSSHNFFDLATTLGVGLGVSVFAFAVSFFAGSSFAPVTDSSAAEISVVNEATGYYANITSTGTINLNIASTPDGAYKTGKDTLSIDTNAKNGYKL